MTKIHRIKYQLKSKQIDENTIDKSTCKSIFSKQTQRMLNENVEDQNLLQ